MDHDRGRLCGQGMDNRQILSAGIRARPMRAVQKVIDLSEVELLRGRFKEVSRVKALRPFVFVEADDAAMLSAVNRDGCKSFTNRFYNVENMEDAMKALKLFAVSGGIMFLDCIRIGFWQDAAG